MLKAFLLVKLKSLLITSIWICTKILKTSCCFNSIKNYSKPLSQIGHWKLDILFLSLSIAVLSIPASYSILILSN